MGILSTALTNFLFFRLLPKVGAANTLQVGFLVLVWAALLGVTLVGERLRWTDVCGLVLGLSSLLVINGSASRRGPRRCHER
ncbi:MAG: hypothetical protein EOP18_00480 [Rhizobiaceae bacterium]|nr:MAG: hypothetical protein EOP18_00480 [Rhizobiaceae bacterium]